MMDRSKDGRSFQSFDRPPAPTPTKPNKPNIVTKKQADEEGCGSLIAALEYGVY